MCHGGASSGGTIIGNTGQRAWRSSRTTKWREWQAAWGDALEADLRNGAIPGPGTYALLPRLTTASTLVVKHPRFIGRL